MEHRGFLITGDFVGFRKGFSPSQYGVIIAKRQANTNLLCPTAQSEKYQWVYYVLMNNGCVEGPMFSSEIHKI
jgi:hypothetical protein